MKTVSELKSHFLNASNDDLGDYVVNFCDQDGDSVTIDNYYLDDDGDLCLESNEYDNNDYTVDELCDILNEFADDTPVYVYDDDTDIVFYIEEGEYIGYIGDDGNLYFDVEYDDDDDDDDE